MAKRWQGEAGEGRGGRWGTGVSRGTLPNILTPHVSDKQRSGASGKILKWHRVYHWQADETSGTLSHYCTGSLVYLTHSHVSI